MATTMKVATPLLRTVSEYPTDYWNDSCSVAELTYAIENGAVGATSNPTIVGEVMRKEADHWEPRVRAIAAEHPTWTDVAGHLAAHRGDGGPGRGAPRARSGEREGGRKGRLSIQTNPTFHGSTELHARAGAPVRCARAEHAGEVPGDERRASRRSSRRRTRASTSTRPSASRCRRRWRSARRSNAPSVSARPTAWTPRRWPRSARS